MKLKAEYSSIHKEIIDLSKNGNPKAQYQLYQLYSKAMFNTCMRIMNNREESEDMLQEAFTYAFIKLVSFRHESSFGAWLKRIVVNTCINEIKRKKADIVLFEELSPFEQEESNEETKDFKLELNKIRNAMENLSEGYRIVFSLYLFEGYDHTEISEILNISKSTSKSQYMRAKQKIKQLLN